MRDIKQVTNYDFQEGTRRLVDGHNLYYVTATFNNNLIKLGYCAGDGSIQYPLIFHGNEGELKVYPGKEGMYEIQNENETMGYEIDIENFSSVDIPQSSTGEPEYTFVLDQVEES